VRSRGAPRWPRGRRRDGGRGRNQRVNGMATGANVGRQSVASTRVNRYFQAICRGLGHAKESARFF